MKAIEAIGGSRPVTTEEFAQRVYKQIRGFGEYGFPESHAASFALLVYASAWLKHHHPEVFAAAMINSQPLGFYAPAQLIRDAKEHGVEVLPVDVNHSQWDCTLEPGKEADIIAVEDSPLDDIRTLENVTFVMKGGRVVKRP